MFLLHLSAFIDPVNPTPCSLQGEVCVCETQHKKAFRKLHLVSVCVCVLSSSACCWRDSVIFLCTANFIRELKTPKKISGMQLIRSGPCMCEGSSNIFISSPPHRFTAFWILLFSCGLQESSASVPSIITKSDLRYTMQTLCSLIHHNKCSSFLIPAAPATDKLINE